MEDQLTAIERVAKSIEEKKYLSSKEIIGLGLGKSQAALCHWRQKGWGPPYIAVSRGKYLYPVPELIAWIEARYITNQNIDQEPTFKTSPEKVGDK